MHKVLIEDYTGQKCPNCPPAAEAADAIQHNNPNNVVIIASHVFDVFARPNQDTTSTSFRNDFRNSVSTEWASSAYFKIPSLPNGVVNRKGNPNYTVSFTQWASLVNTEKALPQSVRLNVKSYYDTLKHYLSVNVKATFLKTFENNVNVVMVLTQDSIVGDQYDARSNVYMDDRDPKHPQRRLHYKFDHIVIDVINGAPGQTIKAGPINIADTASASASCYLLNKCFGTKIVTNPYIPLCVADKYVNLVVFVYDLSTNEVLQVEKLRIK